MKRILLLSLCTFLCFICDAQNTININWKDSVNKSITKSNKSDSNSNGIFIAPIMVQQQSNDKCCGIKRPSNKPSGKAGNSNEFNLTLEWIKQYKLEIEAEIDTKAKEFEDKVNDKKEILDVYDKYLDMRENLIDRWLTIIGIIISVFGIVIPLAGIYLRNRLVATITKQQEELNNDVNNMKKDISRKIQDTDNEIWHIKDEINQKIAEANSYIIKLREYDKEGEEILSTTKSEANRRLAALSELALKSDLTDKEKNDAVKEARLITKEKDATPYEKEVASAHENYFSGYFEKALNKYLKLLVKFSDKIPTYELGDLYFNVAHCAQETGDDYLAISYYLQALKYKSNHNATTYNNLANAYSRILDYEKSINNYKKAIEIDPNYAHAYSNYGNTLAELRNYDAAIELLQTAIKLDPSLEDSYPNLAELYLLTNNIDKAKATIEQYINKEHGWYTMIISLIQLFELDNINVKDLVDKTYQAMIKKQLPWSFRVLNTWLKYENNSTFSQPKKDRIRLFIDEFTSIYSKIIQ
ncbi:MAG: tetratricopeptide repeat protein [Flavipsychrobacter sp.]